MLRMVKVKILTTTVAFVLMSAGILVAQPSSAAPVPSQIMTSKKVFISNAGVDSTSLAAFNRAGDPQQHYDLLYAAMKSWGQYELVSAPADADLVFEVRFTAPLTDCGKVTSYAPLLGLTILDTKTHFALWTLSEPVQGAFRKATWNKNLNEGVASLIDDLKKLASGVAPTVADIKK